MNISRKFIPSESEQLEQKGVSTFIDAAAAFDNKCCELIVRGYQKAIITQRITKAFDEEDISDFLGEQIELYCLEQSIPYHIDTDSRDRHQTVDGVKIKGKKRKRFDIKFSYFSNPQTQNVYGAEAKNLSEKNSSKLIADYISEKGMKKFINSIYSKKGCMIGYIREGDTENIFKKINDRIASEWQTSEQLVNVPLVEGFNYHYESNHPGYQHNPLKHLLLYFSFNQ